MFFFFFFLTDQESKFHQNFHITVNNYLQAKIGKHKELEAALQRLRGKNADISEEAADIIVNLST